MDKFIKLLPLLVTLLGTISASLAFPDWVSAHPTVSLVLVSLAQVLHAALPTVFPTNPTTKP